MALAGSVVVGKRGSYLIDCDLKSGGTGIVQLGHSNSNYNEKVILKTPKRGTADDATMLDKLRVEAQVLSKLNHNNIVKYIDERDKTDTFYLIMEFIEGRNLDQKYSGRCADEQTVKRYIKILLEITKYLHGQNIIHRDINPKNIMVDNAGRIVLIDFGTAKKGYVQVTNTDNTLIGTPFYSAPEQLVSGQVTEASDIYSIGAVMLFLLTGKSPVQFMRQPGGLMKPPWHGHSSISKHLSDVVLTAMDQDPKKRYQTAVDMINALDGVKHFLDSPYIVVQGMKYPLKKDLVIGRAHTCDKICRSYGFSVPQIQLQDPETYLSKHHTRIFVDDFGSYWIQDLGSLNKTAISRDQGKSFQILHARIKEKLLDGNIIALAYNFDRGAYITITFKDVKK